MARALEVFSAVFVAFISAVLLSTKDVSDFKKQFVAYAVFHQDHTNKLSHEVCVWPILWTFLVMFHHSGAVVPGLPFTNHAFFVAALYIGCYSSMAWGPLEGTAFGQIALGLVVACWVTSGLFAKSLPGKAAKLAFVINAAAWAGQFYTHAVYEGRAPALLKNPAQAFLFAPIFVLSEGFVDRGIGDYPAKIAEMQPALVEATGLLNAGKYEAVNQLFFSPHVVAAGFVYALFLMLSLRSGGSDGNDAKLKQK